MTESTSPARAVRGSHRAAGLLTLVEAVAVLGFALFYVYEMVTGATDDLTRAATSGVLILVFGLGLLALARGWARAADWPRTPDGALERAPAARRVVAARVRPHPGRARRGPRRGREHRGGGVVAGTPSRRRPDEGAADTDDVAATCRRGTPTRRPSGVRPGCQPVLWAPRPSGRRPRHPPRSRRGGSAWSSSNTPSLDKVVRRFGSAAARAKVAPRVWTNFTRRLEGGAGGEVDVRDRRAVEDQPRHRIGRAGDELLHVLGELVRVGVEQICVEAEHEQAGRALHAGLGEGVRLLAVLGDADHELVRTVLPPHHLDERQHDGENDALLHADGEDRHGRDGRDVELAAPGDPDPAETRRCRPGRCR